VLNCEAIVREGSDVTAVLLHPHPDYGGDRFHPVVDALYHGLPVSTLRFDFRSSDTAAAAADVREAMAQAPTPAVVLMGYSFGADVALSAADPRLLAWFAAAAPLRLVPVAEMAAAGDGRPKRLVVPEHDQYSAPDRTRQIAGGWPATSIVTVPSADHFLVGRVGDVLDIALGWLPEVLAAEPMA